MAYPVPQAIHRDDREIVITWEEGHVAHYPARELRLSCQCAGCREEMTGRPILDPDSVPTDVSPVSVSLVGGYAIKITWSDGHDTGIYSFDFLSSICPCPSCRDRGD